MVQTIAGQVVNTMPDVNSAERLAQVFTTQNAVTDTWLAGFLNMVTTQAESTISEILRGRSKDNGEEYPPLIAALVATGRMDASSAKSRRSEVQALYYGWNHNVSKEIADADGWSAALKIARERRNADKDMNKRVTERNAVLITAGDIADQSPGMTLDAAKEIAVQVHAEQAAQAKANATVERTAKVAGENGYMLFPLLFSVADVVALLVARGTTLEVYRDAINGAILERDHADALNMVAELEKQTAFAAIVAAERAAHKVSKVKPPAETVEPIAKPVTA